MLFTSATVFGMMANNPNENSENDGKYRVEYTSDALTQIRDERIRKINKKIKKTREEINDSVLGYLFAYKNRFEMDNDCLKKLVK